MGFIRRVLPLSRAGMAVWAFRNREQIVDWAGHGVRSVPRLFQGEAGDVVTETRLRAALAGDKATKSARGLTVSVRRGVAELRGPVDAETAMAATRVAERVPGVRSVRDATQTTSRSRFGRNR